MTLPKEVKIVEVGPRDGLQNEATLIPAAIRAEFINRLAASGLTSIEAGSFVSPKWVPQMAGTDQVLGALTLCPGTTYSVLVPNMKGYDAARHAGVREIAVFTTPSETFCQKNLNCSVIESLHRFQEICKRALDEGMRVRGYVSCVMGCPFEGEIALPAVLGVTTALLDMGCYEVSLGDTIGSGTIPKTHALIDAIETQCDLNQIALHFHDTQGQALVNIYTALQRGVHIIDSAVKGLGGCPYAPGAAGNVATEKVLYMVEGLGINTGINREKLLEAGAFICQYLQSTS